MGKLKKQNTLDLILEQYGEDEKFLKLDDFDDAIIGVSYKSRKLVYSIKKCMKILTTREGMEYIDAIEWLSSNILGSHVGDKTPIFVEDEW